MWSLPLEKKIGGAGEGADVAWVEESEPARMKAARGECEWDPFAASLANTSKLGPCLDAKFQPQIPLCKKKIPITSKCRHMYGVLNVDEIKN
jgi:hypothetical protein